MSYEDQELQDGSTGADGDGSDGSGEGADDLTMALSGGGETSFVSESKQPLSKGTMVVAGLLIACGAVTYFMYVRTGPAEAAANPEQAKNEQIVGSFLGDPNRAKGWKELIESTDKVVQQFKKEIPQVLKLPGNPFEKNKPMPTGDQEAQREKERVEKQKLAAKEAASNELKLQTIIHRDPKKAACMINNMMYRKGQKITLGEGKPTFTVDEIRPDAVTVSTPVGKDGKDSVKFDLAMKH